MDSTTFIKNARSLAVRSLRYNKGGAILDDFIKQRDDTDTLKGKFYEKGEPKFNIINKLVASIKFIKSYNFQQYITLDI